MLAKRFRSLSEGNEAKPCGVVVVAKLHGEACGCPYLSGLRLALDGIGAEAAVNCNLRRAHGRVSPKATATTTSRSFSR